MKIKPALAAFAAAGAAAVGIAGAPFASADADVKYLGQPGELVNGNIVQHWTITGLKPSTDVIPYRPVGTLWEATATDEAISGNATPIVSNLNARAKNGDTYRVLFGVATPQGVNPSTLTQGQKTTGKIYFDVTGEQPDSVLYNTGGADVLLWVQAPPAPATGSTGGGSSSAQTYTTPSEPADAEAATPATPATPAPGAAPASVDPALTDPAATPAGSAGTPLPEGSSGTPLPEGSSGTPLPAGTAAVPEAGPAPVPAAVAPAPAAGSAPAVAPPPAPAGSAGTPLPQGPAPGPAPIVVPAPPA